VSFLQAFFGIFVERYLAYDFILVVEVDFVAVELPLPFPDSSFTRTSLAKKNILRHPGERTKYFVGF
jgi:hypothetical protein